MDNANLAILIRGITIITTIGATILLPAGTKVTVDHRERIGVWNNEHFELSAGDYYLIH